MNIPTPADPVMEMARKIAQEIEGDRDGSYSNQVYLGALAAIRATTEAAAALCENMPTQIYRDLGTRDQSCKPATFDDAAGFLRANKHIKGSDR